MFLLIEKLKGIKQSVYHHMLKNLISFLTYKKVAFEHVFLTSQVVMAAKWEKVIYADY